MEKNPKILIADDSAFMRTILKNLLAVAGFTNVVEAGDGKEALKLWKEEKPELVLLDLIMPEPDGMAVLAEIGSDAKVVVISAVGQEGMRADAKRNGALGYIVKPFDEKQVVAEVKKALSS